jgi:F-type H+-transporting ATPase subunit gamma
MQTMEDLRNQVESTRDLSSITRAMKALAAVRIRQSRKAVESLVLYSEAVERGFQIFLRNEEVGRISSLAALREGPTVALVMGSDLGMVGGFNRTMADFVTEKLGDETQEAEGWVVTVGERVAGELEVEGRRIAGRFSMPDTVEAMAERVQDLVLALERLREEHAPARILAFHQAYLSGSDYEPRKIQLLPLSRTWLAELADKPWPTRVLPSYKVEREKLLAGLVEQHLFLTLFRAMAESYASENASRLAAMESAEQKISERLDELTGRLKQQQKQQMTEELLDIMAGATALEEEGGVG